MCDRSPFLSLFISFTDLTLSQFPEQPSLIQLSRAAHFASTTLKIFALPAGTAQEPQPPLASKTAQWFPPVSFPQSEPTVSKIFAVVSSSALPSARTHCLQNPRNVVPQLCSLSCNLKLRRCVLTGPHPAMVSCIQKLYSIVPQLPSLCCIQKLCKGVLPRPHPAAVSCFSKLHRAVLAVLEDLLVGRRIHKAHRATSERSTCMEPSCKVQDHWRPHNTKLCGGEDKARPRTHLSLNNTTT